MTLRREDGELERVFVEHQTLLRNVVGGRVGDVDVVDDITAEVWVAAATAYRNGRESQVTTGWLVTVTKRRVVDHWRRAGADRRRIERLVGGVNTGTEVSALEALLAADQSLLDLVGPEPATVLRLRYVEGWPVGDIADRLAVSYEATESRLARARRCLRDAVDSNQAAA